MRELTLYDRLQAGGNDSSIHLDDSPDYPASSAAACSAKSIKSSSTISLQAHSQAALASDRITLPAATTAAAAAADSSDSGYSTPNQPSSTACTLPSDSMPSSAYNSSFGYPQSDSSVPSLSFTSSTTVSRETASGHMPIAGVPLLYPDEQVVDPQTVGAFGGAVNHAQQTYQSSGLPCLFWFINCDYRTDNWSDWVTHCSAAHFRDKGPPRAAICTLCDRDFKTIPATEQQGRVTAWQQRLNCMYLHLRYENKSITESRPDLNLFDYLWRKKLITAEDWVELKQNNRLARSRGPVAVYQGGARRRAENPQRSPQAVPIWQTPSYR